MVKAFQFHVEWKESSEIAPQWFVVAVVVVQSLGRARLCLTPWTAAHQASLSFTIYQNLLKLGSIESVMPSNHLILCHPLLLLPSIFPSIRVFSNESALHIRWPKYWNFSISPSSEYLISFRRDCSDLLAAQGTLKILLKHHSSKASILWCSAFFMVQPSLEVNSSACQEPCAQIDSVHRSTSENVCSWWGMGIESSVGANK